MVHKDLKPDNIMLTKPFLEGGAFFVDVCLLGEEVPGTGVVMGIDVLFFVLFWFLGKLSELELELEAFEGFG